MREVNYTVKDENGKIFHTKNYMDASAPGNRIMKVYLTDFYDTTPEDPEERERTRKLRENWKKQMH